VSFGSIESQFSNIISEEPVVCNWLSNVCEVGKRSGRGLAKSNMPDLCSGLVITSYFSQPMY
jgi:hypothetical protein